MVNPLRPVAAFMPHSVPGFSQLRSRSGGLVSVRSSSSVSALTGIGGLPEAGHSFTDGIENDAGKTRDLSSTIWRYARPTGAPPRNSSKCYDAHVEGTVQPHDNGVSAPQDATGTPPERQGTYPRRRDRGVLG